MLRRRDRNFGAMPFQETMPRVEPTGQVRRWFANDRFELIVWLTMDDQLESFQLYYDKPEQEAVVIWHCQRGWSHHQVDQGQANPGRDLAPMLVPLATAAVTAHGTELTGSLSSRDDASPPVAIESDSARPHRLTSMSRVLSEFKRHSQSLDPHIRALVLARLTAEFEFAS